jgi:hypothetical protein
MPVPRPVSVMVLVHWHVNARWSLARSGMIPDGVPPARVNQTRIHESESESTASDGAADQLGNCHGSTTSLSTVTVTVTSAGRVGPAGHGASGHRDTPGPATRFKVRYTQPKPAGAVPVLGGPGCRRAPPESQVAASQIMISEPIRSDQIGGKERCA